MDKYLKVKSIKIQNFELLFDSFNIAQHIRTLTSYEVLSVNNEYRFVGTMLELSSIRGLFSKSKQDKLTFGSHRPTQP